MGVRNQCVERVRELWPLAYGECENDIYIDLRSHLVNTANAMLYFFNDRLKFLDEAYKNYNYFAGSIRDIAYTIGLLHDFAKSSLHYLNMHQWQRRKVSFPYHEHVASLIILQAAYIDNAKTANEINAYITISRVIARHHSAIQNRHPYKLCASMNLRGVKHMESAFKHIEGALRGLCEPRIVEFAENLAKNCNSDLCRDILNDTINVLNKSREPQSYIMHLKNECSFNKHRGEEYIYDSYRITSTLSGFLIIADGITSSYCEKRTSDDEATPAYIEAWMRELYPKTRSIEEICLHQ